MSLKSVDPLLTASVRIGELWHQSRAGRSKAKLLMEGRSISDQQLLTDNRDPLPRHSLQIIARQYSFYNDINHGQTDNIFYKYAKLMSTLLWRRIIAIQQFQHNFKIKCPLAIYKNRCCMNRCPKVVFKQAFFKNDRKVVPNWVFGPFLFGRCRCELAQSGKDECRSFQLNLDSQKGF